MAIKIKEEKDIEVTREELHKLSGEYQEAHKFYSGQPPTLEEFIRRKKLGEERKLLKE